MQPSSLIFLAVVAIWGAFLVQYWVRRREDVATARSADRFSEAMHVLERRPVLATADPRPPFSVYAAGSPLVARGTRVTAAAIPAPATGAAASPTGPTVSSGRTVPASGASAGTAMRARVASSAKPTSAEGPRGVAAIRRAGLPRVSPRMGRAARGVALVLTIVALPVVVTAAALGLLPWKSLLVWAAVLVVLLVSLRAAAVRERTRRHTAAQLQATNPGRRREAASPRLARPAGSLRTSSAARVGAPAAGAASPPVAVGAGQPRATSVSSASPAETRPEPPSVGLPEIVAFADFGVDPDSVTLGPPDDDALHGQWSPVDVPPPTYTLKAKASPPVDRAAESERYPAMAETTATAIDVIDVDDDDVPARWVVGG